jgi:hypothetical protein
MRVGGIGQRISEPAIEVRHEFFLQLFVCRIQRARVGQA